MALAIVVLALNLIRLVQFSSLHAVECSGPARIEELRDTTHQKKNPLSVIGDPALLESNVKDDRAVRTVRVGQRSNAQDIYAKASEAVQNLFTERQLLADCSNAEIIQHMPSSNTLSIIAEVGSIATELLTVTALSGSNTVLTLQGVELPSSVRSADCKSFDCLFKPLTTCPATKSSKTPMSHSKDCDKDRIVQQMIRLIGFEDSKYANMLDWSFFSRETLRFVTRPSNQLETMIKGFRSREFTPLDNWEPFTFYAARVAVHIPFQSDRSMYDRFSKGLKIHVYGHGGTGLHQVLLRADSQSTGGKLEAALSMKEPSSERDWRGRSESINNGKIPVLVTSSAGQKDSPLMIFAQAFIFAECDYFVGDFDTNFSRLVGVLMRMLRFSHFAPTWDVQGNPFNPSFRPDQSDG